MNFISSHEHCLTSILKDISLKYLEKKYFLDVGCGDGERTWLFDGFSRIILGVDRECRLKENLRPKIKFFKEDFILAGLSFKNKIFDIVLSFDVVEHLYSPEIMLKEIYRVLKSDGIFLISTPNKNRFFGFFLQLFGLRRFPYFPNPKTVQTDPYSAHVTEYTISELKKLLENTGFIVLKTHKIFYGATGRFGFCNFFSLPLFHNIILECGKK